MMSIHVLVLFSAFSAAPASAEPASPGPEAATDPAAQQSATIHDGAWRALRGRRVRVVMRDGTRVEGELAGTDATSATIVESDGRVAVVNKVDAIELVVPSAGGKAHATAEPVTPAEPPTNDEDAVPIPQPAPPLDTEVAPGRADEDATSNPQPAFQRTGFFVGGGTGIRACVGGELCDHYMGDDVAVRVGALNRLFAGYRFVPWIAAGASLGLGAHPLETTANEFVDSGHAFGWHLLADLWVHPVRSSRIDPYAILGLGFIQDRGKTSGEDGTSALRINRGLVRFAIGLDIFAAQRFSLGPRFDFALPFAGKACFDDTCSGDIDGSSMPKWVGFTVDFKGHF